VRVRERKTLTLGSKIPYAIYHQSPAPRKRLPRRPEIMLTEEFKRGVMHHMQVYLVQMASQLGLRNGMGPYESSRVAHAFGRGMPTWAEKKRDASGRFVGGGR